jgi:hypothetical protein
MSDTLTDIGDPAFTSRARCSFSITISFDRRSRAPSATIARWSSLRLRRPSWFSSMQGSGSLRYISFDTRRRFLRGCARFASDSPLGTKLAEIERLAPSDWPNDSPFPSPSPIEAASGVAPYRTFWARSGLTFLTSAAARGLRSGILASQATSARVLSRLGLRVSAGHWPKETVRRPCCA